VQFVCLTQPINALAFVFDGINYGASDFGYAAYSMASWQTSTCHTYSSNKPRALQIFYWTMHVSLGPCCHCQYHLHPHSWTLWQFYWNLDSSGDLHEPPDVCWILEVNNPSNFIRMLPCGAWTSSNEWRVWAHILHMKNTILLLPCFFSSSKHQLQCGCFAYVNNGFTALSFCSSRIGTTQGP
jgi:hypothetical protein